VRGMYGDDYNSWGWQTPRELALPGNGLPGGAYTCFQRADQHVLCLFVGEARSLRSRTAEAVPARDVYSGALRPSVFLQGTRRKWDGACSGSVERGWICG